MAAAITAMLPESNPVDGITAALAIYAENIRLLFEIYIETIYG